MPSDLKWCPICEGKMKLCGPKTVSPDESDKSMEDRCKCCKHVYLIEEWQSRPLEDEARREAFEECEAMYDQAVADVLYKLEDEGHPLYLEIREKYRESRNAIRKAKGGE